MITADTTRYAIAAARFNDPVVAELLAGALDGFAAHGIAADRITVLRVPGAFELPLAAKRLAATGRYRAVIALGAVIRGETAHFDHVAASAAGGLTQAALDTGIPVIFGVLTCDTLEQALARAARRQGNKGFEMALAALEMSEVINNLPAGGQQ